MAMNFETRHLIDTIIEYTAIKSGILLTENNIITLSKTHSELEDLISLINSDAKYIRIYPDEFEAYILALRKSIGNIPDTQCATAISVKKTKALIEAGHDVEKAQEVVMELIKNKLINDTYAIITTSIKHKVHPKTVIDLLIMYGEMQNRSPFLDPIKNINTSADWDGIKKLDSLFDAEILPTKGMIYFDQEFINYLKENTGDLLHMHWRNFERLIAEFFNKNGYEVVLGPGRNDGGIDIRIFNKEEREKGPPLIIVQCKRHSAGNLVDVNTVKAFYSDMLHEEAKIGLIATTSRIAPIGKETIKVRGYNIAIAETKQIERMVKEMWRHDFHRQ